MTTHSNQPTIGIAKSVYFLLIAGILLPFANVIGVVIAHIYRSDAPDWLRSHYDFQVRTFWIGVLFMLLSMVLTLVMIGYFMALLYIIWLIVRCVKGYRFLSEGNPHPDPKSWLF